MYAVDERHYECILDACWWFLYVSIPHLMTAAHDESTVISHAGTTECARRHSKTSTPFH